RRQFKGDDLYALCLKRYIGKLLLEGHPIEFFIEGGRSRIGKLLSPRFGMLRMVVDSYLEQPTGPVRIIPCNVAYERVIEGQSHQKEVQGGSKGKENIGALLRSTKVLTSRYGRLYVTFGDPIDLGDYLDQYEVTQASEDD